MKLKSTIFRKEEHTLENVKIKITTTQTIDEAGNEDVIELVTEASLECTQECIIINYDESHITENNSIRTRLKIYKDKLIMTKIGTFSSKMEFEKNRNYKNLYSTPYGTFDLYFNTIVYNNELNELGRGFVYIEYNIILGNSVKKYNKLRIDIF